MVAVGPKGRHPAPVNNAATATQQAACCPFGCRSDLLPLVITQPGYRKHVLTMPLFTSLPITPLCTAGTALLLSMSLQPALAAQASTSPVKGSQPATLGLNEAVKAANSWHPSLRNASGQLLQTQEGVSAAKAGYYPQVRAGISSESSSERNTSTGSTHTNLGKVTVSQMLYDFGKVASSVSQAEASAVAARYQVQLTQEAVTRETALVWVELSHQQAMSEIATSQVEGVKALADLAMEREKKGASTRSDSLQAQSRVESAAAQAINIASQVQRNRISLMQLTGSKVPVSSDNAAPQFLAQACGSAEPAIPNSLILRAQALRDAARAGVDVADSARKPTLSLDGSVQRGLDSQSRSSNQSGLNSSITLNLSAPLYEGGGNQARLRAAMHAVDAAEASIEQTQLQTQQGLQDAKAQFQGQRSREPLLAQRIESIKSTKKLYADQYLQLGTRSLLELLNAEQEYHSARFDQVDSQYEQLRLGVECLYQNGHLRDAFLLDAPIASTGGNQ